MGGSLLLKYVGDSQDDCLLKALVTLASPFDHVLSYRALNNNWMYFGLPDQYILKNLKAYVKGVSQYFLSNPNILKEKKIDLEEVYDAKTTNEFNKLFTIKLHGFKSIEQYYREGSSVNSMHNVKIPVLAISSLDDPIVSHVCIPYEEFKSNPYLGLAVTRIGGHLSWFTGNSPKRWFPQPTF